MGASVNDSRGIRIDVDDLIAVRSLLNSLGNRMRRRQASARSGARELQLRGRGMEYAESRAYVYGDDIRTMDWRVMARTGEAHSKVFAEEKDRCCLLATDLSASMYFGTRRAFKSWAAAQVAAHVGWFAHLSGERIGGLVASPAYHAEVRPGKARSGLLGVFHHLAIADQQSTSAGTNKARLGFLLRELRRVTRPGATIAIISDFLGLEESGLQALADLTRHNEVVAYWVHDDTEVNTWPADHYAVIAEAERLALDLTQLPNRDWLNELQSNHRIRLETTCAGFGIPLRPISCNQDITAQLLDF